MSLDIDVSCEDGRVTIAVTGQLDAEGAHHLLHAAASAAAAEARRLEIDLRRLASFTTDGVLAVTGCRRLSPRIPDGVSFVVAGGAGSSALLESYTAAP